MLFINKLTTNKNSELLSKYSISNNKKINPLLISKLIKGEELPVPRCCKNPCFKQL